MPLIEDNVQFITVELCGSLNEARTKALAITSGNTRVVIANSFEIFSGGQVVFSRRASPGQQIILVHHEA